MRLERGGKPLETGIGEHLATQDLAGRIGGWLGWLAWPGQREIILVAGWLHLSSTQEAGWLRPWLV
jgi:hypothetical protein